MNNDSTFIIISTVLIASLMSICSALRSKKTEVDTVLKEYKSNQRGGKEMPTENNYHTLSDENHSEKPEMAESLSVDPEVLIDWDFLQSYSNDLDY